MRWKSSNNANKKVSQNLTDLLFLTAFHSTLHTDTHAFLPHQNTTLHPTTRQQHYNTKKKCPQKPKPVHLIGASSQPGQCHPHAPSVLPTAPNSGWFLQQSQYVERTGHELLRWFLQQSQYVERTGHELLRLIPATVTVHRENRAWTTRADSCNSHSTQRELGMNYSGWVLQQSQYIDRTVHELLRLISGTVTVCIKNWA